MIRKEHATSVVDLHLANFPVKRAIACGFVVNNDDSSVQCAEEFFDRNSAISGGAVDEFHVGDSYWAV